jgi:site-specific recombinase XerD
VRVQKVVPPDGGNDSWTVLHDDWSPVEPIEAFLAHLTDQERSPNTVKAYAHDLKDYFEYLEGRRVEWQGVRFEELAGFKPWLRLSPAQRRGGVAALPSAESYCTPSTINRKLAAVTTFYEFHVRNGVHVAAVIKSSSRPASMSRTSFRPFLVHTRRDPPRRSGLTVQQPPRRPHVLTEQQVEALFAACTRLRDEALLGLLLDTGLRIGEALGLRHEDVNTPDGVVEVRQRVNANEARAKTWERAVPVGASWLRLYADYLHEEYGALDSDYVFVTLWSNPRGRPMTYAAVSDLFRRLGRRTGIAVTPHMFRHTYATKLLRAGVKAETVQKLLGHASVSTTIDTYSHLTVEDVRRELRKAGCLKPEEA